MSVSLKKLILFTLSACPIGRSMNTVINELLASQKNLAYEKVYLDINHEKTNRYRVMMNPTTIFLDGNDDEVYRVEGFKEIYEVYRLIRKVEAGLLRTEVPQGENREIAETYTIYLFHNGNAVPIETSVINKTSVKAPRINSIRQLLRSRPEGFENPFRKLVNEPQEVHILEKKDSKDVELKKLTIDMKCPNNSSRVKRELRNMKSFTPIKSRKQQQTNCRTTRTYIH
jgi:hypothetical protein